MKKPAPQNWPPGAILLGLLVVAAIGAAAFTWWENRQLAGDFRAVTHAYAITNQLESLMSRITDGETGERGFLITGSES
jgi:CHASE3 domain sensor protein